MADYKHVVEQVKADLEARGVPLSGPDGAGAITLRVAWALRHVDAGLLDKPNGNHFEWPRGSGQFFATDIVMFPNGEAHDMLGDGGGANNPQWGDGEMIDASRYRRALDPGDDTPKPPDPEPPEPIPPIPPTGPRDTQAILDKVDSAMQQAEEFHVKQRDFHVAQMKAIAELQHEATSWGRLIYNAVPWLQTFGQRSAPKKKRSKA